MLSVDEIEVVADGLSLSMCHVLGRCSDAGFWPGEETGCWREWRDVVSGRQNVSFNGSVRALERRGLVAVRYFPGLPGAMVAVTRTGLRVQAALRLRA